MIAYFVHDHKKDQDLIVLPDLGCAITVDVEKLNTFIGPQPEFNTWGGDRCGDLAPENFGEVLATREDTGDVCVLRETLWQARMAHYLGEGTAAELR